MAVTVSFINMKGGVGKTTLAAQIAHASDKAGYKTLVVDLDPQSNISQSLLGPEKYVKHIEESNPTLQWCRFSRNTCPHRTDMHPRVRSIYMMSSSKMLVIGTTATST